MTVICINLHMQWPLNFWVSSAEYYIGLLNLGRGPNVVRLETSWPGQWLHCLAAVVSICEYTVSNEGGFDCGQLWGLWPTPYILWGQLPPPLPRFHCLCRYMGNARYSNIFCVRDRPHLPAQVMRNGSYGTQSSTTAIVTCSTNNVLIVLQAMIAVVEDWERG